MSLRMEIISGANKEITLFTAFETAERPVFQSGATHDRNIENNIVLFGIIGLFNTIYDVDPDRFINTSSNVKRRIYKGWRADDVELYIREMSLYPSLNEASLLNELVKSLNARATQGTSCSKARILSVSFL